MLEYLDIFICYNLLIFDLNRDSLELIIFVVVLWKVF